MALHLPWGFFQHKNRILFQCGAGAAHPPLLWEFFHRESPSQHSFFWNFAVFSRFFSWHYGAIPVLRFHNLFWERGKAEFPSISEQLQQQENCQGKEQGRARFHDVLGSVGIFLLACPDRWEMLKFGIQFVLVTSPLPALGSLSSTGGCDPTQNSFAKENSQFLGRFNGHWVGFVSLEDFRDSGVFWEGLGAANVPGLGIISEIT